MKGLKARMMNYLKKFLGSYGYEVIARSLLYDWQKTKQKIELHSKRLLPNGSEVYLQNNNPRLIELREKYKAFDSNVTTPLVWTENWVKEDEIRYFRSDNAYLWQLRGKDMNILSYSLATYYVKSIDRLGLLDKLVEDYYFGIITFQIDNKVISRDLIDSIIEIYYLEKQLGISSIQDLKILDIGAGYGRLAHRMTNALPNIHSYFCTDAFALSTFISEYYTRYRNLENKAKVVPLYDIEKTLASEKIDIAINIHSFSECQISAIEWWLHQLEKNKVKYLMIVPNVIIKGSNALLTNDSKDFQYIIENHGYKLIAKEPKYSDPVVQEYAANPTYHYLFKLENYE